MSDRPTDDASEGGEDPLAAFGAYLRTQRQLAKLSLRQLAELTRLSNPYLSQLERGLHQPSIKAVKAIADALDLQAETLIAQLTGDAPGAPASGGSGDTEAAIRNDPRLTAQQKAALLSVYESMVGESGRSSPTG